MTASVVRKYAAFARIAIAQERRGGGELLGRVVFFAVVLGVFSSLYRAVAEAGMPLAGFGGDSRRLVWYLAATEWIVLSVPHLQIEIQETVRRGDVVYRLGRPASFVLAALAAGLALLAVRAPVLAATAFACAYAFTGWVPPLGGMAVAIPFCLAAAALLTALHLWIGLFAFWLQDVAPVFWLCQKAMFVLGGLMLPLQFYPEGIQRVAALTPFPVIVGDPASLVVGGGSLTAAALARDLGLWSALVAAGIAWTFQRASVGLTANGG